MNRKFLAIGLASALSLTAAISGVVPGTLVGKDISKVMAAYTSVAPDDVDISYDTSNDDPFNHRTKRDIAVGETRTPKITGAIRTTVTDYSSSAWRVNSDLDSYESISKYTYRAVTAADFTWSSSDPTVISVDDKGVIKALKSSDYDDITITAILNYKDENGNPQTSYYHDYIESYDYSDDYLISEEYELTVGDTFTFPKSVKTRKGVTSDDVYYAPRTLGYSGYEWNETGTICKGDVATYDSTTNTLTVTAPGKAGFYVSAYDKNNKFIASGYYHFYVHEKEGKTVTDEYGNSKYVITSIKNREVAYAGMVKKTKQPVIPSSVTINGIDYEVVAIADGAFKGTNITSVKMPTTIRKIGASAFEKTKLTEVDCSNAEITEIGAKAFYGTKLTELTVDGDSLKKVGKKAVSSLTKKSKVYIVSSTNKVFKNAKKKFTSKSAGGKKAKYYEQD